MSEPCPSCRMPMVVEDGLNYCPECDAYHGEDYDEMNARRGAFDMAPGQ